MRCSWCSDLLSSSVSFRHSSLAPVTSCWACSKRCLFPFSSNPSFSICLENYRTTKSIFKKYIEIHFKKKKKVIKAPENNAHFCFWTKVVTSLKLQNKQIKVFESTFVWKAKMCFVFKYCNIESILSCSCGLRVRGIQVFSILLMWRLHICGLNSLC